MVERLARKAGPSPHRAHIDNDTTLLTGLRVLISEDSQGLLTHVDHTPEVRVKHSSRLVILGAFRVARESVTSVIDDNIDATKLLQCETKCSCNGRK